MDTIRVVWGSGRGPTDVAAYDAALADAGVHNYNLVHVSSIIPEGATVEPVGTAPDLGPVGNRLTVVEAAARAAGPTQVSAGLGWSIGNGAGLFYEAAGETDTETVEHRLREGLDAGRALRGWTTERTEIRTSTIEAASGTYLCAVVLGVYGQSEPIL